MLGVTSKLLAHEDLQVNNANPQPKYNTTESPAPNTAIWYLKGLSEAGTAQLQYTGMCSKSWREQLFGPVSPWGPQLACTTE